MYLHDQLQVIIFNLKKKGNIISIKYMTEMNLFVIKL